MNKQVKDLICETMDKYSEYLSEDIDSSSFIIHILAAQLFKEKQKTHTLSKIIASMRQEQPINQ